MRTQSVETELVIIAPAPRPAATPKASPRAMKPSEADALEAARLKERRAPERRKTEPNLIERLVSPRDADRRDERDRRATPRVAVQLECEERSEGARYFRITEDLSTFGLATRQGFPHPTGTRLQLSLHLPDVDAGATPLPLELEAEVVGHYDERGGTRLAFRQPSVEAVKRIHKFLAARVPELAEKG